MRVLIVSHRFPPDAVAGVERYSESLAAELTAAGEEVTVLARRPGPGPVRAETETDGAGFEVLRLAGGTVDRTRPLHLADELDARFEEVLARVGPEIVHVNHLIDLSPRFVALARAAGAAVVMTLHDFWFACPRITLQRPDGELCGGPEGGRACATHCFADALGESGSQISRWGVRAMYFRRVLESADRVLTPSPHVADWFRNRGLDRVMAVPNGIALPRLVRRSAPDPRRRGRLSVAILGAVVPHKGHHVALEAIAGADIPAVDLFVHGPIGDPAYVATLRARAEGIDGLDLRLCGPYDPSDLDLLLEDVDVLVAPSVWPETFCLVTREAVIRGVPVLTTRLGALPDAVDDGVNGFLFDHDHPAELARHLKRMWAETGLLDRLSEGAAATRVTSTAEHARAVREVYAAAAAGARSRGETQPDARIELEILESLLADYGFGDPTAREVA